MCRFLVGIVLLLFSLYLDAQNVKGRVVSVDMHPVGWANVLLYSGLDTNYIAGTITDSLGCFNLQTDRKGGFILKISQIAYSEQTYHFYLDGKNAVQIPDIILRDSNIMLGEVNVRGYKPAYQLKNGILEVDVQNSMLRHENQLKNLLRKIPGMTLKNGEIEVFGRGKPAIYINGRKALDVQEVTRLDVKEIDRIQLITHPGVEFDQSDGAVILVTLKKRMEGWSLLANGAVEISREFSHNEDIAINYQHKNINFFTTYSFLDSRKKRLNELNSQFIGEDTVWKLKQTIDYKTQLSDHSYSVGFDGTQSKHSFGMKYDGYISRGLSAPVESDYAYANDSVYNAELIYIDLNENTDRHHVNAYYYSNWNRFFFKVFGDYVYKHNYRRENMSYPRLKDTYYDSDYNMFIVRPQFSYRVNEKNLFVTGGELSFVDGRGATYSVNNKYENKEQKYAVFFNYQLQLKHWSLETGMRYEYARSDNNLLGDTTIPEQVNSNWFPQIKISHNTDAFGQSFSYSVRTVRPPFAYLNSTVYYDNYFMYRKGNPELKPQIVNTLQYNVTWNILYFSCVYEHIRNYIGEVKYVDFNRVIVSSYQNYRNYARLNANIGVEYQVGFWEPSLSLNVLKPFFHVKSEHENYFYNKPFYSVSFNNYFKLPKELLLSIDYNYSSRGNHSIYTLSQTHEFNLGLQKTFFKEQLLLTVQVNDVFRQSFSRSEMNLNGIRLDENYDWDTRSFIIGITYRFKQYKDRYRGTSMDEEIRRL